MTRRQVSFGCCKLEIQLKLKKGSLVSTSGLGKYKSSDLPLGTVTSTQKASDQLGQEIRVKPKANLDVNRYVLLIGE